MSKDEFISNFLDNSRRLQKHKLPYGMAYLSLLEKVENDAEKKWNKLNKQPLPTARNTN